MKKTMRFLCLAALALVGAVMTSCSNEDDFTVEPENKSNVVTLTTTVGIGGGAGTRALAADGVKTFAAGETMAVVYKNQSGETAMAVTEPLTDTDIEEGGKSATFTVTLDSPDKLQNVTYIYPAAMADSDGTVKNDALATQDGTLASLASNLDYCTNSGAWTNGTDLPSLTLENQFAILALTLKNGAGSREITSSITGLTVSDGTNSYAVSRSAADGPIYVAIRPTTAALEITATDGSKNYTKSATSREYAAGNGYSLPLRMLTVISWNQSELQGISSMYGGDNGSRTLKGVTLTKSDGTFYTYDVGKYFGGVFQFSTVLGNFTKIELTTTEGSPAGTGWSGNVWTGNASTVNIDESGFNATNIVFTIAEDDVAVSSISLNKTSTSIEEGKTETLTATVSPAEATDKSVTWTSSNTSVATVDASGVVTAVAVGEATITAEASNGRTATCTVTVTAVTAALNSLVIKDYWGTDGPTIYYFSGETWSQAITNHSENQSAAGRWRIDNANIIYDVYGDYPYVKGILADPGFEPINPNTVINPLEPSYYEWLQ